MQHRIAVYFGWGARGASRGQNPAALAEVGPGPR